MLKLWLLIIASGVIGSIGTQSLETYYEWKYIRFLWDTKEQEQWHRDNEKYVPQNIIPIDVDRAQDGRVFITFVGGAGVPASVAVVTSVHTSDGPLVRPFPDWSWYNKTDCTGIISVYRVAIDDCNRIYILDNGYSDDKFVCPPKLLLFDLSTDELLSNLTIPVNIAQNKTGQGLLVTPIIDARGPNCTARNIYLADGSGAGLVVWNGTEFMRFEGPAFQPQPSASDVFIAGETFHLEDSVISMALTKPRTADGDRSLIFRPFASRALYAANQRYFSANGTGQRRISNPEFLPSQATLMALSGNGTLFLALTAEMALACYNTSRDLLRDNLEIVLQDVDRLQFVSGMKIRPRSVFDDSEELWMLSDRYQKKATGTMDFTEVNFRIMMTPVQDLLEGGQCA